MEQHVISLIVLIAVAVNTLSLSFVVHCNLIIEDLCLFKCSKMTLCNLHISPCHIRWLNQTIGQILVDRLFGNDDIKRVIRQPFTIFLAPYLYLQTLSFRGQEHIMPFLLGYLHLHTTAVGLLFTIRRGEACHTGLILTSREHKVEWCYVTRYSYITIIGENGWQALGLLR